MGHCEALAAGSENLQNVWDKARKEPHTNRTLATGRKEAEVYREQRYRDGNIHADMCHPVRIKNGEQNKYFFRQKKQASLVFVRTRTSEFVINKVLS